MVDTSAVADLLEDRSYHIEFNGHLTNHAKHAVVALAGLGTPPETIRSYYENYTQLTSYGFPLERPRVSRQAIDESNWRAFVGHRQSFSAYVDFFENWEKRVGLSEVLRLALPVLLPGWIGAFTHATIHLGWALDAASRGMAIEGLAYMAYTYVSCRPELKHRSNTGGREGPVEALLRILAAWEAAELERTEIRAKLDDPTAAAAQEEGIHPELVRSGLQYRIAMMASIGHPLLHDLPDWGGLDLEDVWLDLYRAVTLLYLAKPGDFVILHLITSLHGVEQLARSLPAAQHSEVIDTFWTGAVTILLAEAQPPPSAKVAALHRLFRRGDRDEPKAVDDEWDYYAGRAVLEIEEHNPKLVYVLRLLWQRTGGERVYRHAAAQFTRTPDLPRSFDTPPQFD